MLSIQSSWFKRGPACAWAALAIVQQCLCQAPDEVDEIPEIAPVSAPERFEEFKIRTVSPENKEVPFYVRAPRDYNPERGPYRVLFLCPVLSGDARLMLSTHVPELLRLADEKSWFVLAPTFLRGQASPRDRKECYYYPERWSGKAVLDAIDDVSKKYAIAKEGMFCWGLSGGAQFVHRFAIWAPDRVAAVAVNSASWFDDPKPSSLRRIVGIRRQTKGCGCVAGVSILPRHET
jgi:predicted peptidase